MTKKSFEKKVCDFLKDDYSVVSIKSYPGGAVNHSFFVRTREGEFTVRVFLHASLAQIKKEVALLDHLSKLPVPKPVAVRGKKIFTILGKNAIMYPYLSGRSLARAGKKELEEVGNFLARFHKEGAKANWSGPKDKFYDLPAGKIARMRKTITAKRVPFQSELPGIIAGLKKFALPKTLPKGPIHVDVKPENVLSEKGELSGVIDFDNAYRGPFVLDLAKSMVWFGLEGGGFDDSRAREILKGYERVRRLSSAERKSLPRALHYAFLSHVFVDYYMFALGKTDRNYFTFIAKDFYSAYRDFEKRDTLTKYSF